MKCKICKEELALPFKCKFCGEGFCADHRLPENHKCPELKNYSESTEEWIYNPRETRRGRKIKEKNIWWPITRFLSLLFFRKTTNVLMAIIILISLIGFFVDVFFNMFALLPSGISSSPWILITSMFLHGGFLHLFFNMYVLFMFGNELENRVGSLKFLEIFFVSGIAGSFGYLLFSILTSSNIPAVGASGAIFGILGALAIIAPEIKVIIFPIPSLVKLTTAIIIVFAISLLLEFSGVPIANSAHLGGVLVGILYGFILKKKLRKRHQVQRSFFDF